MRQIITSILLVLSHFLYSQVITYTSATDTLRVQLPFNRLIRPAGTQVFFGNKALENHSLDAAISPDGKWLAVMERYSIIFISTENDKVAFRLANNDNPDLRGGSQSLCGAWQLLCDPAHAS